MMVRIIIAAALALAACGPKTEATATATASVATGLSKPEASAQTSGGGKPGVQAVDADSRGRPNDNYSLVGGSWGDEGNCGPTTTAFNADGTFHSNQTGGDGTWTLNGDQLTMTGKGGEFHVTLTWVDADHTIITQPDGSIAHSQRCPARG